MESSGLGYLPCYASSNRTNHVSPGYMSAQKGHHFANPTNHFWKCLHQSGMSTPNIELKDLDPRLLGFTSWLLSPSEDHSLPASFNIGLVSFNYFLYLASPKFTQSIDKSGRQTVRRGCCTAYLSTQYWYQLTNLRHRSFLLLSVTHPCPSFFPSSPSTAQSFSASSEQVTGM